MSGTVLYGLSDGLPVMRVRNEAEMASTFDWTADVVTFPPNPKAADWMWGAAHRPDSPSPGQRMRRRARRAIRSELHPLDVNFAHFDSLRRIIATGAYDVVHWKDLAASLEVGRIARELGCRFVLDMHENYPYNMWSTERDRGVRSELYNLNEWFRYERASVLEADSIVVTIDEMGQRLIGMHGVPPEKIVVLQNTEPVTRWREYPSLPELATRFAGKAVILYGGGCSAHRGLDTIISALPAASSEWPEIALVIVGEGGAIASWRALAERLDVIDRVFFEGWKPFSELQAYHALATFGVVPHHQYGQTDNTVPHKLYQNMMSGLPTLVSSCHSLQRIIRETGAGVDFKAGDPESAASAITKLKDPRLREELAERGRIAVRNAPYSWETATAALKRAYRA